MKKLIAAMLCAVMTFGLCACSSGSSGSSGSGSLNDPGPLLTLTLFSSDTRNTLHFYSHTDNQICRCPRPKMRLHTWSVLRSHYTLRSKSFPIFFSLRIQGGSYA